MTTLKVPTLIFPNYKHSVMYIQRAERERDWLEEYISMLILQRKKLHLNQLRSLMSYCHLSASLSILLLKLVHTIFIIIMWWRFVALVLLITRGRQGRQLWMVNVWACTRSLFLFWWPLCHCVFGSYHPPGGVKPLRRKQPPLVDNTFVSPSLWRPPFQCLHLNPNNERKLFGPFLFKKYIYIKKKTCSNFPMGPIHIGRFYHPYWGPDGPIVYKNKKQAHSLVELVFHLHLTFIIWDGVAVCSICIIEVIMECVCSWRDKSAVGTLVTTLCFLGLTDCIDQN